MAKLIGGSSAKSTLEILYNAIIVSLMLDNIRKVQYNEYNTPSDRVCHKYCLPLSDA